MKKQNRDEALDKWVSTIFEANINEILEETENLLNIESEKIKSNDSKKIIKAMENLKKSIREKVVNDEGLRRATIKLIENTRSEIYDKFFPLLPDVKDGENNEEYYNSDRYSVYEQAVDNYYDIDAYFDDILEIL